MKARQAGFEILRCTSFFAVTLPLVAMSRLRRRSGTFNPSAELRISTAVNGALATLMAFEEGLVRLGAVLPFGSSLILIGRRSMA